MSEKPYFHLCIALTDALSVPVWPQAVKLADFQPDMIVPMHRLLAASYEAAGNPISTVDVWWETLCGDVEYDPAVIFPVTDYNGQVIAFAHCWSSGFIKDIVVDPRWRKQGIGEALLLHCFRVFKARGVDKVSLKVEQANGFGAEQLYRRVGMTDA